MLSSTATAALIDRNNIALAGEFLRGFELSSFKRDLKTFCATTRVVEIISEGNRRLPDNLRERHPQIAWRDMRDAGNRYRHDYDDVSPTLDWKTVREGLPPLLVVVGAEPSAADLSTSSSKDHDP